MGRALPQVHTREHLTPPLREGAEMNDEKRDVFLDEICPPDQIDAHINAIMADRISLEKRIEEKQARINLLMRLKGLSAEWREVKAKEST